MRGLEIDARLRFLEGLGKEPEFLENLGGRVRELQQGAWAQSFIDCVYQYSWHHTPDLYDKYILFDTLQALSGIAGDYIAFQVRVEGTPFADKDIEGNNEILRTLANPFEADFIGGNQDEDGTFSWSCPIHSPIKVANNVQWVLLDKHQLPLEVGTNSAFKFRLYMNQYGGVARWPYGSEYITVFVNRELIKTFSPVDARFQELIALCPETIDDCMVDRNPWERWKAEVIAEHPPGDKEVCLPS